jgi:phosphatidylcholine synthase
MSSDPRVLAAILVHALTASGAGCGLVALVAAAEGRDQASFLWLCVALVVDSIDGPLARRLDVRRVVPAIDGALLDNVVDYLTYVVVPAVLVYRSVSLPAGTSLIAAAWICIVAAVQFSHVEAKTKDGLFRGFPSCWNVVALYLVVLRPAPIVSLAVIVVLGALSFAPIYCVYPNRLRVLRHTTIALTTLWIASVALIVARLPGNTPWLTGLSLTYIAYYAALSLTLTLRRPL